MSLSRAETDLMMAVNKLTIAGLSAPALRALADTVDAGGTLSAAGTALLWRAREFLDVMAGRPAGHWQEPAVKEALNLLEGGLNTYFACCHAADPRQPELGLSGRSWRRRADLNG